MSQSPLCYKRPRSAQSGPLFLFWLEETEVLFICVRKWFIFTSMKKTSKMNVRREVIPELEKGSQPSEQSISTPPQNIRGGRRGFMERVRRFFTQLRHACSCRKGDYTLETPEEEGKYSAHYHRTAHRTGGGGLSHFAILGLVCCAHTYVALNGNCPSEVPWSILGSFGDNE